MPQQEHYTKGKKTYVGPGKIAQLLKCANTGTQVQTSAPKLRKKIKKKKKLGLGQRDDSVGRGVCC